MLPFELRNKLPSNASLHIDECTAMNGQSVRLQVCPQSDNLTEIGGCSLQAALTIKKNI